MEFPEIRLRRLRSSETMRRLVRQTTVSVDDLVYPLFVCPGEDIKRPTSNTPTNEVAAGEAIGKDIIRMLIEYREKQEN